MYKLLLLFSIVGLATLEVAALLTIGGWLGVIWTLAWMFASLLGGVLMLRLAGLSTLIRIHKKLREEVLPTQELMDMGLILVGAFFLILPGFVTDAIGLLTLLPPFRWLFRGILCAAYGHWLPPVYAPGSAPEEPAGQGEDIIEIHRKN